MPLSSLKASLLLCLLPVMALAQQRDLPGYILTPGGDTVRGSIRQAGDIHASRSCVFTGADGTVTEYKPGEIRAYRFAGGKFYVSDSVSVDGMTQHVFLEFLVDGIVDLFTLPSQEGMKYFIRKEDGALLELKNTEEVIVKDDNAFQHQKKEYIGYLKFLFSDAPALWDDIDRLALGRRSLIRISSEYHDAVCKDYACVVYEKTLPPLRLRLGPAIGQSTLSLDSRRLEIPRYSFPGQFNEASFMSFGLSAVLTLPYLRNRLELAYTGLFRKYDLKTDYSYKTWDEDIGYFRIDREYPLRHTDLNHYIHIRYRILGKRFSPVILAGAAYSQKLAQEQPEDIGPYILLNDIFPKKSTFGYSIGAGLSWRYAGEHEVLLHAIYNHSGGAYTYFGSRELLFTLGVPFSVL